jgi:hypothetical protein
MSSKKEPFINKRLRPKISPDTRLAELTVKDLVEILTVSNSRKPVNTKELLGDNIKTLIPDLIKNWKEVALEKHTGDEHVVFNNFSIIEEVLEGISGEILEIKRQLSKGR